jgi:Methyltransferase domain
MAKGQPIANNLTAALSPASFWVPDYFCASAWIEHAPFAFWICEALRPRCFIELGTHYGYSYFVFCQAIDRLGFGTTAYAIDTWKGDEHAGFYGEDVFQSVAALNNQKYSGFSTLIRSTFEEAVGYFGEASIDLLHIDGRHFYDDVKNDFSIWRPKLAQNAVVLFHDTNVRERGFAVWKFFGELAEQYPHFQFFHGHGLGVLIIGESVPSALVPLIEAPPETADQIRAIYAGLGSGLSVRAILVERDREVAALRAELVKLDQERANGQLAAIGRDREITAASPPPATADASGALSLRADAILAAMHTARAELTKSWLGKEILRTGLNRT